MIVVGTFKEPLLMENRDFYDLFKIPASIEADGLSKNRYF